MAHFAQIDENGIVLRVIVIDQEMIDTGLWGDPASWIQTSYNTVEGEHKLGGTPLRKNYAGIGFKYDRDLDAFIPPKKFPSWVLDEEKGIYVAPKPRPMDNDKRYIWSEKRNGWFPTQAAGVQVEGEVIIADSLPEEPDELWLQ